MKRFILFFASIVFFLIAHAKTTFRVEGLSRSYNHIRVINQTTQENFSCRLVSLTENEDGSFTRGEVYGIYNLKKKNDIDTNTKYIKRGTLVGIEMPADFPEEVEAVVEYSAWGNAVRVTLVSKDKNFESF